jgi:hypothetical protein
MAGKKTSRPEKAGRLMSQDPVFVPGRRSGWGAASTRQNPGRGLSTAYLSLPKAAGRWRDSGGIVNSRRGVPDDLSRPGGHNPCLPVNGNRVIIRHQPSIDDLRLSENPPETNFQILRLAFPSVTEAAPSGQVVGFDRGELQSIFNLYGRMVAQGVWRDYAMDFSPSQAVFSIFRRNGEAAAFRIVKEPKAIRKQGAYSVVAQTGLILKRGPDLSRVLLVLEKKPKLVFSDASS